MAQHELKCWPEFFQAMLDGNKLFDARLNDRDYKVGDTLLQREWKPEGPTAQRRGDYTGRTMKQTITYMLIGSAGDRAEGASNGGIFGIKEGYCVLGIRIESVFPKQKRS